MQDARDLWDALERAGRAAQAGPPHGQRLHDVAIRAVAERARAITRDGAATVGVEHGPLADRLAAAGVRALRIRTDAPATSWSTFATRCAEPDGADPFVGDWADRLWDEPLDGLELVPGVPAGCRRADRAADRLASVLATFDRRTAPAGGRNDALATALDAEATARLPVRAARELLGDPGDAAPSDVREFLLHLLDRILADDDLPAAAWLLQLDRSGQLTTAARSRCDAAWWHDFAAQPHAHSALQAAAALLIHLGAETVREVHRALESASDPAVARVLRELVAHVGA